jgi:carotenoid cleavage dioxygenase-like enzyme
MLPVRMSGGIARALRMLPGIMTAPAAVVVMRRNSRRVLFRVIELRPFFQWHALSDR